MKNWNQILPLAFAVVGFSQGVITTIAGTDVTYSNSSVPANSLSFGELSGVSVSPVTGKVYFVSSSRSLVVEFDPIRNVVAVVAGIGVAGYSGDGGPATRAALSGPSQLAFDAIGDLYIADSGNGCIRKLDSRGIITTVVTNDQSNGLALGPDGSRYIAGNNQIVKVNPNGIKSVIAGTGQAGYSGDGGPATGARLNYPTLIALDSAGGIVFLDASNFVIRRIGPDGAISTIAGNGQAGTPQAGPALFSPLAPTGLAIDNSGNLWVGTDGYGQLVMIDRKGTLSIAHDNTSGRIPATAVPASSGDAWPNQLAFDASGNLYFTDAIVGSLFRLSASGSLQVVAGYAPGFGIQDNGPGLIAGLSAPGGLGLLEDGSLLIADRQNHRIRRLSASGTISTVVGSGQVEGSSAPAPALGVSLFSPTHAVADFAGNIYVSGTPVLKVSPSGNASVFFDGTLQFLAADRQGNIYGSTGFGNQVLRFTPDGKSSVYAGNGRAGFAGDGGPATSATLNNPAGLTVCPDGNVYVADGANFRIRRILANGTISTIAGGGTVLQDGVPATQSALYYPYVLACDLKGNLFLTDVNRVRVISTDGLIHTIAGSDQPGFAGDGGPASSALLASPSGLAVDAAGNIYVSDTNNNRVRKIFAVLPSLSSASTQLTISGASQGGVTQTSVSISTSLQGLSYSVSTSTATGGSWLTVASSTGTAPGQLAIIADPGALQVGTYRGTITLNSPYANPASISIAITFQVGPSIPPSLSVHTQSLSFAFNSAGGSETQQLTVVNQSTKAISFAAAATTSGGGAWLSVTPANGAASSSTPGSLSVSANAGTLSPGTYSGSITITSPDTGQTFIVPVTLSISASQQQILLSQTGLSFTAVSHGGAPLPQTFGILNAGQGSMAWTATESVFSGGANWLHVDQSGGTVDLPMLDVAQVQVTVDPTGLDPGNYFGQIQVHVDGAANSPQSLTVLLNVLAAGSNPGPEIQPTGLVFIGTSGSSPGAQTVTLSNATANALDFGSSVAYVSRGNWLDHLPSNARLTPGQPTTMILQPDFSKLQPGTQRAALTLVFSDGSIRTVSVLNVITPNTAAAVFTRISGERTEDAGGGCSPLQVHPTTLTDAVASVSIGQPVNLGVRVVDSCGNALTSKGGAVLASFSSGDEQLMLIHVGNGYWQGTWTPRHSSLSQIVIQFNANLFQGVSLLTGKASVTAGLKTAASTPVTFGAANAASGQGTYIAPGGLVAIYGLQLADTSETSSSVPFPTQVNGTEVLMGGKALPLRYVGNGQVNAQVPFDLGINTQQQLTVQHGATVSVPQNVVVAAAQPGIYTQDQSGTGAGVIFSARNVEVTPNSPAHAGDTVVIYCNGLGAVNPPVPTGSPAPSSGTLTVTTNPVTATIGGINAMVQFAGLVPGYPDLYQVNVVVPAGLTQGDQVPITLTVAGQTSPPVTMAVR